MPLLALAAAASACGDDAPVDDGGDGVGADRAITVHFEARVGTVPLDCATRHQDLGVAGVSAGLRDLRLYVHDVRLVDAGGAEVPLALDQDGAFQHEGVALLDFEDGSGTCERGSATVRDVVTGTAPAGDYRGLRFRLGVPAELNHIDVTGAPPPLDLSALFWGWSDGRIFLAASTTATTVEGGERVFQVQLASSGCLGDPRLGDVVSCERPNRGAVELAEFDPDADVVIADLGALLAGMDVRTDPSCHADAEEPSCAALFAAAGVDVATGEPSPATQSFFRVERP